MFDRLLAGFAAVWGLLILAICLLDIVYDFTHAPSLWQGWIAMGNDWNPFNLRRTFTVVLAASPALLALWWLERRRQKH
jgi:hypothetical protein